jgi:adenosine deaminase
MDLDAFIRALPKAELHMHLEGSLEPELLLELGARNGLRMRWDTPEALRSAYEFSDLQSFLDLYYEGCRVLVKDRDFYDMTRAYLSAGLLVTAQRHRREADALALLESVMPWADRIAGLGLGGAERGNPPARFANYFRACRERGFRITVHAGEEGPAAYVREAVEVLDVDRIDHGNSCLDDPALVRVLAERGTPLTVCPLSNVRLKGVPSLAEHPLPALLAAGLNVTLNSDDPAYFGGYVNDNFIQCRQIFDLTAETVVALARNSLAAAFAPPAETARHLARLDAYVAAHTLHS